MWMNLWIINLVRHFKEHISWDSKLTCKRSHDVVILIYSYLGITRLLKSFQILKNIWLKVADYLEASLKGDYPYYVRILELHPEPRPSKLGLWLPGDIWIRFNACCSTLADLVKLNLCEKAVAVGNLPKRASCKACSEGFLRIDSAVSSHLGRVSEVCTPDTAALWESWCKETTALWP